MKRLLTQTKPIKRVFTNILTVAVLLLAISACKKDPTDNGDGGTLPPPNSAAYADLKKLADELVNNQRFSAEDGTEYTSPKGATVTFGANSLVDQDGNDVDGEVELTFVEIYDRGTMVSSDKALMGGYVYVEGMPGEAEAYAVPLVTGGQFLVYVKQGDKMLKPKPGHPYKVVIDARHTGDADGDGHADPDMKVWKGTFLSMAGDPIPDIDITVNQCCPTNTQMIWEEPDREQTWMSADVVSSTYNVFSTDEFGWTNIDKFYSDEREKTQIKVFVPEMYNQENSAVYLAYEGEPNVLAKLDVYDTAEHYFSEHYGYLPIGLKVHLIFTSESNGSIVYAIKTVTITEDGSFTFAMEDLATTTRNNLEAMINALD